VLASQSPAMAWVERNVRFLRGIGLVVGLLLLALFAWSWLGLGLVVGLTLLYEAVPSIVTGQWPFGGRWGSAGAQG